MSGPTSEMSKRAEATSPATQKGSKRVYFFGAGRAEGTKDMKKTLGGKGANLAEMTNLGVPVPPGFTISCDCCIEFLRTGQPPAGLQQEVEEHMRRLDVAAGKRFGDANAPLLVYVRPG